MPEQLLTAPEAARVLRVSASFLNKARLTGAGPSYVKLGRRVFYEPTALETWVAASRRKTTSVQAVG